MNLTQAENAWKAGTPVYYAPEPVYKYFQWEKPGLMGAPFSSETNVPNSPISNLRNEPVIVDGTIEDRWVALVDGNWMPLIRLYASLGDFKAALQVALATKATEAEAIATRDTGYADSVLDIGTSILGVSESSLDFGDSTTELTVEISNSGDARLNWSVPNVPDKVAVDADAGQILPGGDPVTLTITVDRAGVPQGEYSPVVTIIGDNGNVPIQLTVIVS